MSKAQELTLQRYLNACHVQLQCAKLGESEQIYPSIIQSLRMAASLGILAQAHIKQAMEDMLQGIIQGDARDDFVMKLAALRTELKDVILERTEPIPDESTDNRHVGPTVISWEDAQQALAAQDLKKIQAAMAAKNSPEEGLPVVVIGGKHFAVAPTGESWYLTGDPALKGGFLPGQIHVISAGVSAVRCPLNTLNAEDIAEWVKQWEHSHKRQEIIERTMAEMGVLDKENAEVIRQFLDGCLEYQGEVPRFRTIVSNVGQVFLWDNRRTLSGTGELSEARNVTSVETSGESRVVTIDHRLTFEVDAISAGRPIVDWVATSITTAQRKETYNRFVKMNLFDLAKILKAGSLTGSEVETIMNREARHYYADLHAISSIVNKNTHTSCRNLLQPGIAMMRDELALAAAGVINDFCCNALASLL